MNKQCHRCKIPVIDGKYETIGELVTCAVCAPLVSKSALVKAIIGVSYAHSDQMAAVKIVEELEAELEQARFFEGNWLKRATNSLRELNEANDENERLRGIIIDLELYKKESEPAVAHWDSIIHL